MIPATRARLCAALERETGREWEPDGAWDFTADPWLRVETFDDRSAGVRIGGSRPLIVIPGLFVGRNWPERLAAEVARVLSETSTTGEKP